MGINVMARGGVLKPEEMERKRKKTEKKEDDEIEDRCSLYGKFPHALYIVSSSDEQYVKLGHTRDPEKRRAELQTGHGRPLMILWAIRLKKSDAVRIEREIHKELRGTMYHSIGEWYRISAETVKAMVVRVIERSNTEYRLDLGYGLAGGLGAFFAMDNGRGRI